MKYDVAIFDMDGTILNTLEDLCTSLNFALKKNSLDVRTIEQVRLSVGNGIRLLIERSVPREIPKIKIDKIYADFMEHYKIHCADKTKPYEGVCELLQKIKSAGLKTAVVSNKADAAVKELCRDYFPNLFDVSIGEKKENAKKPAPDSVNEVLRILGIPKEKAVYIGDSDVDFETAKNSALDFIGVSWGFRGRKFLEDLGTKKICDVPKEIFALL